VVIPLTLSSTPPVHYPAEYLRSIIGRAPAPAAPTKFVPPSPEVLNLVGERAFGYEYFGANFVKFNLATPGTLVTLGTFTTTDNIFAADFTSDGNTLYAIKMATNQLIRVDTSNGTYTVVGPVTVSGTDTWTSLRIDPNGTAYATSTSGSASTLYTINLTNGATTIVGTISGVPIIIAMAISPSGQMYGYDIDPGGALQSNFYSINKATGAATLIGQMGFVGRFAQDMDFDPQTGTLYAAAYNFGTSPATGELRTINTSTGMSTFIGNLGVPQREVDAFAIKGVAGASADWLSVAPTSGGPVAVNDSTRLTAYFDARSPVIYNLPGNYYGSIEITNPGAPAPDTLKIPVRMYVQPTVGADLVAEPDSVDIGNVEIGRTDSSKTVLVRNIGLSTLNVTNVTFSGASGFSSNITSFSLTSLDTIRLKLRFAAVAPGGVRNAIMRFTSNDPSPDSVKVRAVSVGVAHIVVRPDTFYYSLPIGPDTTRTNFRVINTGTDTLRYSINETLTPTGDESASIIRSMTQQPPYDLPKGAADSRHGEPVLDGSGGPDAFGYRWIDSDEPGGPAFNWVDISTTGTQITTWTGSADDGYAAVPLPFSFPFYGTSYTTMNVITNGNVQLGTGTSTTFSNSAIPSTALPNNAVYPFWDDLDLRTSGSVHYQNDAANGRFIVQWTDVPHYLPGTDTGLYTFQVMLYQNGNILTQYLNMRQQVQSATIGIENTGGTIGLQVVFNAPYMHNNLAILFSTDIITWMSTDRTSGTVAPGDSQSVQLRVHPAGLSNGLYTGYQRVTGNTPDTARVRVRLNATGGPGITVTTPNGGEMWTRGGTYPINWTRTGAVDTVQIDFSTQGPSGPWTLITSGVPAKPGVKKHPKAGVVAIEGGEWDDPNGTYNWTIPIGTPASSNCYVRVSWKSQLNINDISNGAFSILAQSPAETTWTPQPLTTTHTLYAVKTLDANTAWVGGGTGAGTTGSAWRTTNAGVTWLAAGTFNADIYALTAVDANTAIVCTYNSTATRLQRTTNGGATWQTVDSIPGGFYDYVHMFDATNGYAMGDPVPAGGNWVLKRTSNGGVTWVTAATLPAGSGTEAGWNNSMMWFDANNGWFGTNNSRVYRTVNGGANWTSAATNLTNVNSFAVQFNAMNNGLVASQTGSMNRSTDAGATWTTGPAAIAGAVFGMWGSPGSQEFWAVANTNVYYSSNAGTSWSAVGPNGYTGTTGLNHVNMIRTGNSLFGWASGASGRVIRFRRIPTGTESGPSEIPDVFALDQNYPNPFNPTTTVKYDLPEEATVTLKIYNVLGQEVLTLVSGTQAAGRYQAVWDGRNNFGTPVSSGVYFYRIEATGVSGEPFVSLKKMMFLK
jgi:hypothetical protein